MIWNPEFESMPRTDLGGVQLQRLRATAARAYAAVPFYKQQFDAAGVHPDQIQSLADLARLPFTRKQHLRDNYPFGLFAVPLNQVSRLHASSGTRGKPTVVAYTRTDLDMWAEVCARAFCLAGGEPGHIFHNAYGYGLFTGGLGFHDGAQKAGACVVPVSGGNTQRQILLIEDFKAQGLGSTPSYALNIADAMEAMGRDPRTCSLKYGLFGAEPWSESMRQQLEDRLGIDAVDVYGLSEVIGPGVSCECREAKNGLHVQADHFLAEIVSPDNGQPLPEGAFGELVVTSLTKEAFPVIRYRTGDICALYYEPCACGRTLPRMSRVKGRADDMLIIRGVNVFPSEIEFELLKETELAPHYQVLIERQGSMDAVRVQVELAETVCQAWGGFDAGRAELHTLQGRLENTLAARLGIHLRLQLMQPGAVPRSEGKAVRVVDKRPLSQ